MEIEMEETNHPPKEVDYPPGSEANFPSMCLGIMCCPLTLFGSFYTLTQQTECVLLYWGRYTKTITQPGLHWNNCCGRGRRVITTRKIAQELPKTTVIDKNGNPLIISAVFVYNIVNTRKASLEIENAGTFILSQAETVLKQIVSKFPYEHHGEDHQPCLKTETELVGKELCSCLQSKVDIAGAFVHSFTLKEISYAPEIAAGMLRKQQATSLIVARQTIVQGAINIITEAVGNLEQKGIHISEDEKSALVTNVLTVVCSENDTQPVIPLSGHF